MHKLGRQKISLLIIPKYVFVSCLNYGLCNYSSLCVLSTINLQILVCFYMSKSSLLNEFLMKDKNLNNVFPLSVYAEFVINTIHMERERNSPKAITHMKCEFFWRTVIYNNKNNNYFGQLMEVICFHVC